jgi:hypothetical protein
MVGGLIVVAVHLLPFTNSAGTTVDRFTNVSTWLAATTVLGPVSALAFWYGPHLRRTPRSPPPGRRLVGDVIHRIGDDGAPRRAEWCAAVARIRPVTPGRVSAKTSRTMPRWLVARTCEEVSLSCYPKVPFG